MEWNRTDDYGTTFEQIWELKHQKTLNCSECRNKISDGDRGYYCEEEENFRHTTCGKGCDATKYHRDRRFKLTTAQAV